MAKLNKFPMNRRQFLKISSTALLYNFLPLKIASSDTVNSSVWEIEGTDVNAVESLFSTLGGIEKFLTNDLSQTTVLIKPNLCLPHPSPMGTTTSTGVIHAFCEFLTTSGIGRIIIVDHTLKDVTDFQNIELNQVVEKFPEVKMVLANEQRLFQPIEVNGKVLKSTEVLKMLSKIDLFINLATAKHHSATHVSLALKNLMGLIWNRTEFHTQFDLHQAIADLALIIRPTLNVIDASRVLLNGGPTGPGPVITENRLFASFDILALDAVALSRYSFGGKSISAKEVPHLWAAYQNGIGEIDVQQIKVEKLRY